MFSIEKEMQNLSSDERKEFRKLIDEILPLQFTHSYQVTNYIMENKLGNKYKNISGNLDMSNSRKNWTYQGGISPKIYAKLCNILNLRDKKTNSYVDNFIPFKNIK